MSDQAPGHIPVSGGGVYGADHGELAEQWLESAKDVEPSHDRTAAETALESVRHVLMSIAHSNLAATQSHLPPRQIGWYDMREGAVASLDRPPHPPSDMPSWVVPVYIHPGEFPMRVIMSDPS